MNNGVFLVYSNDILDQQSINVLFFFRILKILNAHNYTPLIFIYNTITHVQHYTSK